MMTARLKSVISYINSTARTDIAQALEEEVDALHEKLAYAEARVAYLLTPWYVKVWAKIRMAFE